MWPRPAASKPSITVFMYVIVVVSSALMPMIVGLHFAGRGHEFLHALIHADIVNLKARALGHHAHQVLADIVQIAAHRAHQQHADGSRGAILRTEQRLQHGHAGLHGARGDQHLGHIQNVVLEIFADHAHAGDEALVEHLLHGAAFRQGVLGHLLDFLGIALVKALVHQGIIDHRRHDQPPAVR